MSPIVLNPPAFQMGQQIVLRPYKEVGWVCGVSYVLKPSPYDWQQSGWCYSIKFDDPKISVDVFPEDHIQPLEVVWI